MQETLKDYYNVFYKILTNHGIPAKFYTERHTIFEYKRKTTNVTMAKGRIEGMNQTLQYRLLIKLRHTNIKEIEIANKF